MQVMKHGLTIPILSPSSVAQEPVIAKKEIKSGEHFDRLCV